MKVFANNQNIDYNTIDQNKIPFKLEYLKDPNNSNDYIQEEFELGVSMLTQT